MSTIVIQIGNSDDKLFQRQWAAFVADVDGWIEHCVEDRLAAIHFRGFSTGDAAWQNACWVFSWNGDPLSRADFSRTLQTIAAKYQQDSIAYTVGHTEFLRPIAV